MDDIPEGPEDPDEEDARISVSLAGLAVALAVVIAGLFLADHLKVISDIEDCMIAHHSNCVPVQPGSE